MQLALHLVWETCVDPNNACVGNFALLCFVLFVYLFVCSQGKDMARNVYPPVDIIFLRSFFVFSFSFSPFISLTECLLLF